MKRMNLLLVCGLAAAISSPALAQTGNQPGQDRPGQQPGQQQPGQDREQDRLTRPGQQAGQQDAQQILKQLEGSWHIEIKMDPKLFGQLGADRQRMPGQDRDWDPTRDRDDPTERDEADPTQRDQDDPTQRDRTQRPGQQNQPGQENRPGQQDRERTLGADQEGMVTSRGYSQNRLILGDKVLHEAAVIITGGEGQPGAAAQGGSEQIQALSFLGFDDQSEQYSFVMMTDRSGKFNCNHGEYDASSKKLTFEKEGRMSGMRTGQDSKLDNVKIVLEIISNDEHKVTMYDTSASSRTMPGMRDQDREQDRTPGVQPGQRQQDRQTQSQEGKIVYEATYTRAEGQPGQTPDGRMPGQQRPSQPGQPGGGGQ